MEDRTTVRKTSAAVRKKKAKGGTLINQETIAALQEEIEYLWTVYRIDPYYRKAYMESLAKLHIATYIQLLAKEIENLYNEKAAIQQLCVAVQKREEQIKFIRELNQFLVGEQGRPDIRENVIFCSINDRRKKHLKDFEWSHYWCLKAQLVLENS